MSKRKLMSDEQFCELLFDSAAQAVTELFESERYFTYMQNIFDGSWFGVDAFNDNNTALRFKLIADKDPNSITVSFDCASSENEIRVCGDDLFRSSDTAENGSATVEAFLVALMRVTVLSKEKWCNNDALNQVAVNFGVLMGAVTQFALAYCDKLQPVLAKEAA